MSARTTSTSRDGLGVRRDLTALVGATLLLAILLVLGARPADASSMRTAVVNGRSSYRHPARDRVALRRAVPTLGPRHLAMPAMDG